MAQKKDLTDEDKNNITQAIQAAIAEGKATVALNPQRAANWALLANIYQAVMPFAQGADTFTLQAYSQAVALDPIDPNLRITLGGVYYALGRYDEAIQAFQLATFAKPDLANAHYNLSVAYREKGEMDKAIEEMKIVLTLVPKNTNDYTTAQNELTDLETKKSSAEPKVSETLTAPTKAPAPALSPQITLPSEATPPAQP
jgi:tetratricopeptide (TPR) repeat protein